MNGRTKQRLYKQLSKADPNINLPTEIQREHLTDGIEKRLGRGEVTVQKSNGNTAGSVQILTNTNQLGAKAHLSRLGTPMAREGKSADARLLKMTSMGPICPTTTPEGKDVGLIESLSLGIHVRFQTPKTTIVEAMRRFKHKTSGFPLLVTDMFEKTAQEPGASVLSVTDRLRRARSMPVYCNHDIVGVTYDAPALCARARQARRQGTLPIDCSVTWEHDGIHVDADDGVMMFPCFYLPNLHKLRGALFLALRSGSEVYDVLLQEGIIELISTREATRACRIAVEWKDVYDSLKKGFAFGSRNGYTHMIPHPQLLLGHTASTIPFFNHNQGPRTTYFSNMGPQAVGVGRLNATLSESSGRMDGQSYQMWYPQRPLAQTAAEASRGEPPQGMCPFVAIMDDPFDFEDAIVMDRGFIERGGMRMSLYITVREQERVGAQDREEICNPLLWDEVGGDPIGVNREANYSKLERDGTPAIGTWICKGDVVIGKVIKTQALDEAGHLITRRYDVSKQYRGEDDCVVDKIMRTRSTSGKNVVAVRLRATRSVQKGDKFSSRHGQKGTVGDVRNTEDMPFVASGPMKGVTPDIIMSTCSIPSRMTVGHPGEGVAGIIAAKTGKIVDATPWMRNEKNEMQLLLKALEEECGHREKVQLCDGVTGRLLEATILMAPVFYLRLAHMVMGKIRARNLGPKQQLTHQPREGRSKGGGLRYGEMERDSNAAQGAFAVLQGRMVKASDEYHQFVCTNCNTRMDTADTSLASLAEALAANGGDSRYEPRKCTNCGQFKVVKVEEFPYATKLAFDETQAMGIGVRMKVKHE